MATAVVPWTERVELDEALFRHEVASLLEAGYTHLYTFGTAGEGYAVEEAQFEQIARVFVDEMRSHGAEPMVGVISLSLPTIMRRISMARETLGVRRFQVSLPSWGALDDSEVRRFFDVVLGHFADCDFLHYNLLRTKRLVSAAEYAQIAADHPNLVATKNSTDSIVRIRELIEMAPQLQHFFGERGFVYGSMIGECGLLISLATLNLQMGQRYFDAGRLHDFSRLLELERDIAEITREFIHCMGEAHIDGAYDKALWRMHDPRFPLRLLPPYAGVEPGAVDRFAAWLRENYPRWQSTSSEMA